MPEPTTVLGTATRGLSLAVPVTLGQTDRRRHLYLIGKTGTGKSTLLLTLMFSDLAEGRGFALLDPHGDLAEAVLDAVPPELTHRVVYFDPADLAHAIAFNPLDRVPVDQRPLAAAHLVAAFKHLWADSWGPRLEYILLNSLRLLLDAPGATLLGLPRLLVDDVYRSRLLSTCRDPVVAAFWRREFAAYSERHAVEAIAPLQNKIGALLSPPALRNVIGQSRSTLSIPRLMESGGILIANLSKGRLGEAPAHLIGAVLATAFAQAAEARAEIPEADRRDFHLYADEFQNFATESFATVLSEARKWRLSLTLAHQHLGQLPASLRQAVLGNAGSLVVFRVGAEDAVPLAAELGIASPGALTDTSNFAAWARLMADGSPTDPILLSMSPPRACCSGRARAVMAQSRARHCRPRDQVERIIGRFFDRA